MILSEITGRRHARRSPFTGNFRLVPVVDCLLLQEGTKPDNLVP
jgi:hypothetical protein